MSSDTAPQCPHCKTELQSLGQMPFRIGGTSGGWHLLLGEWADASETVWRLDIYRCASCGRLEFYDHDFSLPYQ